MTKLNYLELPVQHVAAVRDFYAEAFGWTANDYGPEYSALVGGGVEIGLNGTQDQAIAKPLPLIEVEDLEAALASVTDAGGTITVPIFAFPGGRRFHFSDPDGNELGAYINEAG